MRMIFAAIFMVALIARADDESVIFSHPEPKASLELKVDSKQIAGVPILFELTMKNTGKRTFQYWCGGPGSYAPAEGFKATLVDEKGKEFQVGLSNGQYHGGSGETVLIKPDESAKLPALMAALPAGKYTLKSVASEATGNYAGPDRPMVVTWPAMEWKAGKALEVKVDAAAEQAYGQALLKQVRDDDSLARHIATTYNIKSVVDAMIHDLDSQDTAVIEKAVSVLHRVDELPEGLGVTIRRAMDRQLKEAKFETQPLGSLAWLAASEGSDDSLEGVLAYAKAYEGKAELPYIVRMISDFEQPKVAEALRGFLNAKIEGARFEAASALATRRDPAAIPILIQAAQGKDEYRRRNAFLSLAAYWDNQQAMAVLQKALSSADEAVRAEALEAIKSADADREFERKEKQEK